MKPATVLLTVIFAASALGVVVWVGRYRAKLPVVQSNTSTKVETSELPIPQEGPLGKAVIPETEFDFGKKELGSKGSHAFVIRNEGEGPLRVKTGKTSCSQCTVGRVSREDDIPPGESVEVEIRWEIKNPNPQFRQWAEVFTTDPARKRIELVVQGQVERPFYLVPESVWTVGDLSPDQPTTVKGVLYSPLLDAINFDKAECTNPLVSVEWEPIPPEALEEKRAKVGVSIKVTVAPGSPLGPFREAVKIYTTEKPDAPIEFQLTGQRPGSIELKGRGWNPESNTLVLGEFPASQGSKAKLLMYVRDLDDELVLQAIEQKHNSVKFQMPAIGRAIGKSKVYDIEIEVPPGPPVNHRGPNAEEIRLKLNHPGAAALKLFVSYHAL
jgi:hypothetical protein